MAAACSSPTSPGSSSLIYTSRLLSIFIQPTEQPTRAPLSIRKVWTGFSVKSIFQVQKYRRGLHSTVTDIDRHNAHLSFFGQQFNFMGQKRSILGVLLLVCIALGSWQVVRASDPELTTDFAVPAGVNISALDGNFFTSTALRNVQANPGNFAAVTPVNVGKFAALEGLGVSSALLQFPPGTINVPHTHPRGTELLLVVQGTLDVGLIDTTNKLFTQTLQAGDSFVFPKGLVHFQINNDHTYPVTAVAGFSSSNPGLVRLPNRLFKSNISDDVLAQSFGVSTDIITQLKAGIVN